MPIHIDVITELNRRAVEKTAADIEKRFKDVGFEVTPEMNKVEIEAVARYLEKKFGTIHSEVKLDVDHTALSRATRSVDTLGTSMRRATKDGQGMGDMIQQIGTDAFRTSRGLITLGVPIAAIVAIDFGKWAATAAGSLGMIPAVATAAAAGIGTLAIATHGFGDTIKDMGDPKKFAEGLAMLSPNAQQAALSIKALVDGPLGDLKRATQDAFFEGVGPQLERLTAALGPSLRNMTTSIATSFNDMFAGVTDMMMTPAVSAQLDSVMSNISQAFINAAPAAQDFAQAFIDIAEVGSSFLPGMGSGIADMAESFADFIAEARESGKLGEWIQNGIDAISMLAEELWKIGGLIYDIFYEDGQASIESFKDDLESIREVLAMLNGDFSSVGNEFIGQFNRWGEALRTSMIGAINAVGANLNALLDLWASVPILGNAVPDARFVPIDPSPTMGGGGGSFGGGIGGQLNAPPSPGARPPRGPGGFGGIRTPRSSGNRPVPGVPPDAGRKPSDRERRDAIIAGLDPSLWRVDPFGGMPPGAGMPGFRPDMFGPQELLEEQHDVINAAHDLEEATKNRLALERDNEATAEQISDAKWSELEAQWKLQEQQADLLKQSKDTTKGLASAMGELGAALDPDLGISKGLAGLADNLVRFIGNLAAAPLMGKLAAMRTANEQATGITGGHGLLGMLGAQGAFGIDYSQNTTGGSTSSYSNGGSTSSPSSLGQMGLPQISVSSGGPGMPGSQMNARGLLPVTQQIHDAMNAAFPGHTIGGYRADPGYPNEHPAGKALDFMLGNQPTSSGYSMLPYALTQPGVDYVIFDGKTWYPDGTSKPYSGPNPHTDHLHIHAEPGAGPPAANPYRQPTVGQRLGGAPPPKAVGAGSGLGTWSGSGIPGPGGGGTTGGPGPTIDIGTGLGANPALHGGGATPGPTRIGGVAPYANPGGGGAGIAPGGPIDTAIQGAAAAADIFAPGSGQAIQMGMKLANRAIQYGGQVAGIGVSGLMETFLPTGGSELANNNWLTRIAGGIAGAAPALPNLAGKGGDQPLTPEQVQANQQGGQPAPVIAGDFVINNNRDNLQGNIDDANRHLAAANAAPMVGAR